jgi:uncharacterized repeat protein (TIGR01451 family)
VISIRVSVPPGAPAGSGVQNCGEALTTTAESGYGDNRSCFATIIDPTPPPPAARVTIAKSGPAFAKPGGSISYTLAVTNHGPGAADEVVVSDVLDGQIGKVTSIPAGCTLAVRTVTCHAGTLPAHASRTFTISGTVVARAGAGGVVEDCASLYATTPGALMTRTEDAVLAACVSTDLEHRVIPEGPAGTGGGLAPAGGAGFAGSLAAVGWALLATGPLLAILAARRRRRRRPGEVPHRPAASLAGAGRQRPGPVRRGDDRDCVAVARPAAVAQIPARPCLTGPAGEGGGIPGAAAHADARPCRDQAVRHPEGHAA